MGGMAIELSAEPRVWGHEYPPHVGRSWSVDDLPGLPDDGMRYEIIDGVLVVSPAPSRRHQLISGHLFSLLRDACPPEFTVFYAPLAWQPTKARSFEPDLLVVPAGAVDDPISTPVLVVEILSLTTARVDRTLKFSAYADAGVPRYWIIDPGTESGLDTAIETYELEGGTYRLSAHGSGHEAVIVDGPVPLSLIPAELLG